MRWLRNLFVGTALGASALTMTPDAVEAQAKKPSVVVAVKQANAPLASIEATLRAIDLDLGKANSSLPDAIKRLQGLNRTLGGMKAPTHPALRARFDAAKNHTALLVGTLTLLSDLELQYHTVVKQTCFTFTDSALLDANTRTSALSRSFAAAQCIQSFSARLKAFESILASNASALSGNIGYLIRSRVATYGFYMQKDLATKVTQAAMDVSRDGDDAKRIVTLTDDFRRSAEDAGVVVARILETSQRIPEKLNLGP